MRWEGMGKVLEKFGRVRAVKISDGIVEIHCEDGAWTFEISKRGFVVVFKTRAHDVVGVKVEGYIEAPSKNCHLDVEVHLHNDKVYKIDIMNSV